LTFAAPFHESAAVSKRIYGEVIRQRTEYAFAMKWPIYNPDIDLDHYDSNHHTRYLVAAIPGKKHVTVEASMRLTRVERLDQSLSFFMWDQALVREQFERQLAKHAKEVQMLNLAGKHGELWDLTRLMTATALAHKKTWRARTKTHISMLMIFGAGVSHTGRNAMWVFTCNRSMKRFMDRAGIEHKVLAHGKISKADHSVSFLCYSHVHESFEKLYVRNPFFFKVIHWGHYKALTAKQE